MTNEDPAIIGLFIDHYRRAGAERVMVFLDGAPDFEPPCAPGQVDLIVCDANFWGAIPGGRPEILEERQVAIYTHALARCPSDWLLIVDSDELLACSRPVHEFLARVPDDTDVVRIPNVEAVWCAHDDPDAAFGARCFRRPVLSRLRQWLFKPVLWLVYGRDLAHLGAGLAGYTAGKHFIRAGRSYASVGLHTSLHGDGRPGRWIGEFTSDEIFIAHFDAISFEQWRRKFIRRREMRGTVVQMRPRRAGLVELIGATADQSEAGLRALFGRLYQLSPRQYATLRLFNLAFKRDIRQ